MNVTWEGSELRVGNRSTVLSHRIINAFVVGPVVAVLFDPDSASGAVGVFENLVGVQPSGELAWTAAVPSSSTGDCFVGAEEEIGQLVATSWSGWRVRIDPTTGTTVDREFLK